jgi:hypothetical protein
MDFCNQGQNRLLAIANDSKILLQSLCRPLFETGGSGWIAFAGIIIKSIMCETYKSIA